ncbi:hypothetical protein ACFL0Q_07350 [Thermodesulfobacteriota bacterium]
MSRRNLTLDVVGRQKGNCGVLDMIKRLDWELVSRGKNVTPMDGQNDTRRIW